MAVTGFGSGGMRLTREPEGYAENVFGASPDESGA
jgi:hypothetical protein